MAKREFEKIDKQAAPNWKVKMHEIIFEADTPKLETVDSIKTAHRDFLIILEWAFTILFSIEYFLRLISINKPWKYATSFMGIVDLLSTIPTYISLFIAGPQYLLVIRTIRLLRIFRILKLTRYISEANVLLNALRSSAVKIIVFIGGVVVLVLIMGTLMYIIEGPEHGFSSIPTAMYWTVVTITTVGYGDIAPATTLGQTLASIIMLLGYGIIAVPTGIVGGEIARSKMPRHHGEVTTQSCPNCSEEGHDYDAKYCKNCGEGL